MEFLSYKPRPSTLAHLPSVNFVAIIGPTAVGKTTLLEKVLASDPSLHLVLVTTTRGPRTGERNGVDYHFRPENEMRSRIAAGGYVQVAPKMFDDIYATAPEDYAASGHAVMAVLADAMPAFLSLPFKSVRQIVVLPPSWEVWQERIASHQFTPKQLAARMNEARRSLNYARAAPNIIFIVNDDLESAAKTMAGAIQNGTTVLTETEGRGLANHMLTATMEFGD